MFDAQELERLEWAVTSYLGAFGPDELPTETAAYNDLQQKITRRLWKEREQRVRFTYEDTDMTGKIDRFEQKRGDTEEMAVIWVYADRMLYRVPATALIGPAE